VIISEVFFLKKNESTYKAEKPQRRNRLGGTGVLTCAGVSNR
jgi:hypothetical protein